MDTDVKLGASLGGISTGFMTEVNKSLAEMARNIKELQQGIAIEAGNPSGNEDILPEDPSYAITHNPLSDMKGDKKPSNWRGKIKKLTREQSHYHDQW